MSTQTKKPGFRQQPKPTKAQAQRQASALERIAMLEGAYSSLIQGVNANMESLSKRVGMLETAMGAVIEAVGVEEVQRIVEARNKRALEERDSALKALVEKALELGQIELTDTIAEDSLIVGVEKNAEGEAVGGRAQVSFGEIAPEFQAELLGKGVGAVIATKPKSETGEELAQGTFEVLEVYKVLPQKEEAPEAPAEDPTRGETHADQTGTSPEAA